MAKTNELDDEVLDDLEDEEEEEEEESADLVPDEDDESEEEDEEEEDEAPAKADKTDKRVRDLQSKYDKLLAAHNKLKKTVPADGAKENNRDPEAQKWIDAARDVTRNRIYDSDPRFKEFGISASAIAGETPEEMNESAQATLRLISRIVTRTTNKVLREHGFSPEPKEGSKREGKVNWATVSKEEFDKRVKEVSGY